MKVIKTPSFTFMLIIILCSCTRIVYIGKRADPEIILEKEHHNIVFVNLFDYTSPQIVKEKDEIVYHACVMNLIDGLSSFSNDSTFSFFVGDTLKKGTEKGLLTTLLPVDSVINICDRNKCNLLISLDSINIYFDWETNTDQDEDGNVSKTRDFYLNTSFYMSLYSAKGDLINRSKLDNSSYYKSRPVLLEIVTIKPSLAKAKIAAESIAYQAGEDYITKFYPQVIVETKRLYSGSKFKDSNRDIFAKDWKNATILLEQLVKDPDPVIAEKARHNLDIVKEASEASER